MRKTISLGTPDQGEHPHRKGSPRPQSISERKRTNFRGFVKERALLWSVATAPEPAKRRDRDHNHSDRETDALLVHGGHLGSKHQVSACFTHLHTPAHPNALNLKIHTQAHLM